MISAYRQREFFLHLIHTLKLSKKREEVKIMSEKLKTHDAKIFADTSHDLTLPDGRMVSIARARRMTNDGFVERTPRIAHVVLDGENRGDQQDQLEGSVLPVAVSSDIQVLAAMDLRQVDLGIIRNLKLLAALPDVPVLMSSEHGAIIARKVIEPKE